MKVSWLVNVALPEVSLLLNEGATPFGGWLVNASALLVRQPGIELSIGFPKTGLKDALALRGAAIDFYAIPSVSLAQLSDRSGERQLEKIIGRVKPDIVHIFGTEYAHSLAMVNVCIDQDIDVVISIQGLVSVYAKHYMTNLPSFVQNRFTFRDFLKQDNLKQQQSKFAKRGKHEIEALRKVRHVIGRTTWDKACVSQINPAAQYHFCNEILREEFYKHTWDINRCERYAIFVSQGSYPIKGLHFMLEAMPLILERFPDAKLYVGGQDVTRAETLRDKLKTSSYGKYIKELTKRYNLQHKVSFTGLLDEQQMCTRYLQAHVFVSPSSIENSPNSLGEAMALGVPCVVSHVGGVPDMLTHRKEGFLYQADASYMLAHYVCEIFADDQLALEMSSKAKQRAGKTYDRTENTRRLTSIYRDILSLDS
ncbi:Glycosyl transferase, family 1 [Acididesulfobacillus acetoxydans]|uniref:Glycosyl transferase group 1 n=1 Tax=Acididesulfobacillus acetoxydans TaxID=1561005 RepID=A0A8S0Y0H3_9FIRM|nr:glycosyltransferase family 4 protein [Acididesulfobacillus acetoxydans]CAA7603147.1 Glycosyl transferase, family 1 [Acididesulfobacillus acetoxydans]CEJ07625.1 Glycosyl transferase group 1 [Acididesulfobacillus acetoxydans]